MGQSWPHEEPRQAKAEVHAALLIHVVYASGAFLLQLACTHAHTRIPLLSPLPRGVGVWPPCSTCLILCPACRCALPVLNVACLF